MVKAFTAAYQQHMTSIASKVKEIRNLIIRKEAHGNYDNSDDSNNNVITFEM